VQEDTVTVRLNPYLGFRGEAREAMDFYQSVFGGELTSTTYTEGGMSDDPEQAGKIMHAMLDAGPNLVIMGSDAPPGMPVDEGARITISLSGDDEATLRGHWEGLVQGGSVTVPLERAPWGDSFGMCTDRYGIHWMVNITGAPAPAR